MRKVLILLWFISSLVQAQDLQQSPWHNVADDPDPHNYYRITVANGMLGLVSSPQSMMVSDVVLNGVYDNYQRGRISNILKSINHINMNLDVDGRRIRWWPCNYR